MKKFFLAILVGLPTISFSQQAVQEFPLTDVELLSSPFQRAQQTDLNYILALDPDRLLAPYWIDAGIEPKAERYGNWENSGLDGHTAGHYLSALSLMYASTGNSELKDRLEYMVEALSQCQEKNGNGYVGGVPGGQAMWKEIANGNIDAGGFSLNGKWVPLYNIHKLFAGLRDAYWIGGNEQAKTVLIDLTDWFVSINSGLSDAQIQEILTSEHGGMNEVLADVYVITGDEKYLSLAEKYSHKAILDPLLEGEDKLTGLHANTQIPKVIGFERVGDLQNNTAWHEASKFFWETVVNDRTVSIGGNSVKEHFHPVDDFSTMMSSNQGPETCNTYNMLRLTKQLFLKEPTSKYIDYYERGLYNHILSSQHPEGGLVYFTPMRPRHYRVYSQPQLDFWCCVGSGIENHGKYGELIYAHTDNDIYVNLFIPSKLNWKEKNITITQSTDFPYEEHSALTVNLDRSRKFKMFIRKPSWVKKNFSVTVNGQQFEQTTDSKYIIVDRKWRDGDKVVVSLPMETQIEQLPDGSSWYSFVHGPIVLAAPTDTTDLKGIWADDSRMSHVASGALYPIDQAPTIVAEEKDASIIEMEDQNTLSFHIQRQVENKPTQELKLKPFYEIHEARYMIYWPILDATEYEKKMAEIREQEKEMLLLASRTIDEVATGEQQPESDHNFKGEQTEMGIYEGRYWRHAKGWFSYDMRNNNSQGKVLRVTYSGADSNRKFDIYINQTKLTSVHLDGSKGPIFFEEDYPIPSTILNDSENGKLTVKFQAQENSMAGGVYYIRLLKPE